MHRTFILGSLIGIMLTFGLAACGKRGDPYRPSDIPAESQTETPAS
jgi:predicted small lipoprotein YifL